MSSNRKLRDGISISSKVNSQEKIAETKFKNLKKVKILKGDDMFPSICPDEILLLDEASKPKIGDVVLFENRYRMKIAHRLIAVVGNYYFTRGDNCYFLNFPCKRDKIQGVIVGKNMDIESSHLLKRSLTLFLPYFVIYNKIFDIRKKKQFILLNMISRYLIPLEGVFYKSSYSDERINKILYSEENIIKNIIKKNQQRSYHLRKLKDNKMFSDDLKVLKSKDISLDYSLQSFTERMFEKKLLTLYDLMYIKKILLKDTINVFDKKYYVRDMIGFPLIVLNLFDKKYTTAQSIYHDQLSKFIQSNFKKEYQQVKTYLEDIGYQMPISLYHFYSKTKTFKIYDYLSPPIGYERSNSKYGIFNLFVWPIVKIKRCRLNRYKRKNTIFVRLSDE